MATFVESYGKPISNPYWMNPFETILMEGNVAGYNIFQVDGLVTHLYQIYCVKNKTVE